MLQRMEPVSLYIHIPFCSSRCNYCDFNTVAGMETFIPPYIQALCKEAHAISNITGTKVPIHTIYLGGGTPSLLPADQFEMLMQTIRACFQVLPEAEITLEANPGTLSYQKTAFLFRLGFNRISIGMQSASDHELALLGRRHSFADVQRAVVEARKAGFQNLSLDLIYGLPKQTLDAWKENLQAAVNLKPDHLSLYSLTIEKGTPFNKWIETGLIQPPDDDLAADMLEWAMDWLKLAGYRHYEISNWACSDDSENLKACRHNLQYWRNLPYIGLGAGAHGYFNHWRTANALSPIEYIQRMESYDGSAYHPENMPSVQEKIWINPQAEIEETMMVGLRLVEEGISRNIFQSRFGLTIEEAYPGVLQKLIKQGLVETVESGDILRLSRKGIMVGNQVFMQFLDHDHG
ncbi:MAG TPA: radical SAM family heme chaperone HemW [Anaerolineaceae bacterium]